MARAARQAVAVIVAAIAFLGACSSDDDDATPPPSIAEQTLPPTTADPYAVPAVIDAAYVTRVLAGLDQAAGDIVRTLVRTRELTPEVLDQMELVFADQALRAATNGFVREGAKGFTEYRDNPGNTVTTVREVLSSRPDCVFVAVRRDYSAVAREGGNDFESVRRDSAQRAEPSQPDRLGLHARGVHPQRCASGRPVLKRALLPALTAALLLVATPSAFASQAPTNVRCEIGRSGLSTGECEGERTVSVPGSPSVRRTSAPTPRDPTKVYVPVPEVSSGPGGETCLRWADRVLDQPGPGTVPQFFVNHASGVLTDRYPVCPGQSTQGVPPVVYAVQFWRQVKLPDPQPAIAPGWAITGMPSYLETRGLRQKTYTSDTPFGTLELIATGRYYVDWGDGTRTGPHDVEGEPWPDGRIKHTYIDVGRYDVVVTETWSAIWRFGDANGTLSGLQTAGRIDDFRVEQVQAVVGVDRG